MDKVLTYEKYNDRSLAVRTRKNEFENIMRELDGRWNSRMKGGEGWLIPLYHEDKLKKLLDSLNNS